MRSRFPIFLTLSVFLFSILLSSCNQAFFNTTSPAYQKAEVLFEVTLPTKLPEAAKLQLEILDDVTGLAFNPQRFDMIQKDERTYYFKSAFTLHANIKYRYLMVGQTTIAETNTGGHQVRYRLLNVNDPIAVMDVIASWPEEPYQGGTGTITGQFYDQANNTPIPDLLVSAQGVQTLTASDGSFTLRGITPGTHLLSVTSVDGSYNDFQQAAKVAENAITPVIVGLDKRPLVNVRFEVKLPEGISPLSELRLASNLYSLGNLNADVYAGNTMLSADLPAMQQNTDGSYSLNLSLPAGAYFNYKYTLGDGFWNGEMSTEGMFLVREYIVPQKDSTQKDVINSFQAQNSAPILINVTVPSSTPVEDMVSIQFNPYDWLAPIPMTRIDSTHWSFMLYNPQNYFGQTKFRFCRNNLCDLTHEVDPQGSDQVREFIPGTEALTIQANAENWQLLNVSQTPTTVTTEPQGSASRTDFITGFEIDPAFAPLLRSSDGALFASIAATGANWTILQPTWTAASINPPFFEAIPGKDLLWQDVLTQAKIVKQAGLSVGLFPRIRFTEGVDQYWKTAEKDPNWWQHWFDNYHRFIMQNADAANISGAGAIIIGEQGVAASFDEGLLPDGTNSNSPSTANDQWRQLITDIRARYSGPVIGALDISTQGTELPAWFDSVDAVYLIIHPEISTEASGSFDSILEEINTYFENIIKPIAEKASKPILLGLSVPSTKDAYLGCDATGVNCSEDASAVGTDSNLDLELQTRITNAAIISSSSRSYINGFFSRGYQEAGSLQDDSDSVHGKPANDVLWYWYHFLGGKTQ